MVRKRYVKQINLLLHRLIGIIGLLRRFGVGSRRRCVRFRLHTLLDEPSGPSEWSQRIDHCLRSLETIGRILRHHPLDDLNDCCWNVIAHFRQRPRLLFHMRKDLVDDVSFRVRDVSRQQVVERTAQAIDISADVDVPRIFYLFGCNVVDGSKCRAGSGQSACFDIRCQACKPKVQDLDGSFRECIKF